jgi:Ankyrin repeats (3 copies)/KTSC domain
MRVLAYDEKDGRLDVMVTDRRYEFFDVSRSAYEALVAAAEPLTYFNAAIWNQFEHRTHWQSLEELLRYLEDFYFEPPVTASSHRLDEDTPLHVACVWGDVGAVDLLLRAGADPNAAGDLHCTPLYDAVAFGHVRCAEMLLKAGASPDATNELNTTPRKTALEQEDSRMRELLASAP